MESFDEILHELTHICGSSDYNPLDGHDFLVDISELLINERVREEVLEHIRIRKKWLRIKMEYPDLRERIGKQEAVSSLAEKYLYSEKTIEAILYQR